MNILTGEARPRTLPKVLEALADGRESGKLTATRRDGRIALHVRDGRVVRGASSWVEGSLGNLLLEKQLISEATLLEALKLQQTSPHQPLGAILLLMEALDKDTLNLALRHQAETIIRQLVTWEDGFYKFEPLPEPRPGDEDLGIEHGPELKTVLESLALQNEPAEGESPFPRAIGSRPTTGADLIQPLLRTAARCVDRTLLLMNRSDAFVGIAQAGIDSAGEDSGESAGTAWIRELRVSKDRESIFGQVLATGQAFRGTLPPTLANAQFLEQLGRRMPRESIVIPLPIDGAVSLILYGDRINGRPVEFLELLEVVARATALALENAVWKRRVEALRRELGGNHDKGVSKGVGTSNLIPMRRAVRARSSGRRREPVS